MKKLISISITISIIAIMLVFSGCQSENQENFILEMDSENWQEAETRAFLNDRPFTGVEKQNSMEDNFYYFYKNGKNIEAECEEIAKNFENVSIEKCKEYLKGPYLNEAQVVKNLFEKEEIINNYLLEKRMFYKDEPFTGVFKYNNSKNMYSKVNYKEGKIDGFSFRYDIVDGKEIKFSEAKYENNILIKKVYFYKDGKMGSEKKLLENKSIYEKKEFDEDGKIKKITCYDASSTKRNVYGGLEKIDCPK